MDLKNYRLEKDAGFMNLPDVSRMWPKLSDRGKQLWSSMDTWTKQKATRETAQAHYNRMGQLMQNPGVFKPEELEGARRIIKSEFRDIDTTKYPLWNGKDLMGKFASERSVDLRGYRQ